MNTRRRTSPRNPYLTMHQCVTPEGSKWRKVQGQMGVEGGDFDMCIELSI